MESGTLAPVRPAPAGTEQVFTRPSRLRGNGGFVARGPYRAPPELHRYLYNGALLYTACDEDSDSELEALAIGPDDAVLSVTGSGCRSLNLLLAGPGRLVSIDANPLQNHLLELKAQAIRELDHAGFLEFMGVRASSDRVATYFGLRPGLSTDAREFWDHNLEPLRAGVVFSGAHETYYRDVVTPLLGGLWRSKIRELFEFDELEDQRRFYREEWDSRFWRIGMKLVCQPWMFKLTVGDPSYYLHVGPGDSIADYLLERFEHALTTRLARDNHFLALLILGRYHSEDVVPHYLSAEHYEAIRANIDALEVVSADVGGYLAEVGPATFDKYSLSDISGWTSEDEFAQIMDLVASRSRPGGRFCYRNALVKRPIPERILDRVAPRPEVASRLDELDLAFVYTFEVGDVTRPERR